MSAGKLLAISDRELIFKSEPILTFMSFFDRLSTGWTISMNSLKVLRENKKLILFPILSGASLLLILSSFVVALLAAAGWDTEQIETYGGETGNILLLFLFYLVNYFVVVFFNTALVHCSRLYFQGEEVTIGKGIRFAISRIGAIFAWAMLAATVGTILRLIEENVGWLGKIIISLIGIVWSVATFFVVPVIAYENAGPIDAFKRSSQLMREKWGESLGARFSFGLVRLVALLGVIFIAFLIGYFINVAAGVVLGLLAGMLVLAALSAAQTIFISAVYHNVTGDPVQRYNQQLIDNLFEAK